MMKPSASIALTDSNGDADDGFITFRKQIYSDEKSFFLSCSAGRDVGLLYQ
jgi:hypothetical protein